MPPFLTTEIDSLRARVAAEPAPVDAADWAAVADDAAELAGLLVYLLDRIDAAAAKRQPAPPPAWDEAAARRTIPIYRAWYDVATRVKELRQACKAHGAAVADGAEFLHAYNRSKMMALDFEEHVASYERWRTGTTKSVPMDQVLDELRRRA